MLGKTHIAVGVAASLAILQPTGIPACLGAVIGGALGGWIPDVDIRAKDDKESPFESGIILAVLIGILLIVDHFVGLGMLDRLIDSADEQGLRAIVGVALFVGVTFGCMASRHRTLSHSFLGVALWSASVFLACPAVAPSYAIGLLSHIVLDLTNKKGIALFYPLSKRTFCLGLFSADGIANKLIGVAATVVAIVAVGIKLLA